jgi:hypothetical protein
MPQVSVRDAFSADAGAPVLGVPLEKGEVVGEADQRPAG